MPTVSTTSVRSGTQALQFDGTTPFSDLYQAVPGLAAGAYEATSWVYGDGTDVAYVEAFGNDVSSNGLLVVGYDPNFTGAQWHQLVADFNLSGTGVQSGATLYLYSPATVSFGVAWDDLRLVSLPDPDAVNGMNLVSNAGFETDSSAWTRVSAGGNIVATSSARSGAQALQFSGSVAGNYNQFIEHLQPGVYQATAWFFGAGTPPTMTVYDAAANRLAYANGASGAGWQQIHLDFTLTGVAPQNAVTLELSTAATANANQVLVDDVTLVQQ